MEINEQHRRLHDEVNRTKIALCSQARNYGYSPSASSTAYLQRAAKRFQAACEALRIFNEKHEFAGVGKPR